MCPEAVTPGEQRQQLWPREHDTQEEGLGLVQL